MTDPRIRSEIRDIQAAIEYGEYLEGVGRLDAFDAVMTQVEARLDRLEAIAPDARRSFQPRLGRLRGRW